MRLLIFVLLLFSLIPMVGAELHDGWIMDRHDSQRSGVSSSDAPDTAYVLWKLEIPYTNLVNSPLGNTDRIVVRTSRNLLLCIDMNGKEVWRFNKRIDSVIVIENSVIISEGTYLWCLSLEDADLGWAMYTYRGWSAILRVGYGLSIVAGFFTWHSEKLFTFKKWEGKFIAIEVSFIATGIRFHNENSSITGWGASAGYGLAVGSTGVHTRFWRAPDWMIPWWLKGIVVPQKH